LCDQSSLVGLCTQDHNSLCAAVTICSTLVDIQTHRQTFWLSYMSWAKKTHTRKT